MIVSSKQKKSLCLQTYQTILERKEEVRFNVNFMLPISFVLFEKNKEISAVS